MARPTSSSAKRGLGKTTLVRLLQGESPVSIVLGEAVAAETVLPFGLLSEALGSLAGFDDLGVFEGLATVEARAAFYYRTSAGWRRLCTADRCWPCSTTCTGPIRTR